MVNEHSCSHLSAKGFEKTASGEKIPDYRDCCKVSAYWPRLEKSSGNMVKNKSSTARVTGCLSLLRREVMCWIRYRGRQSNDITQAAWFSCCSLTHQRSLRLILYAGPQQHLILYRFFWLLTVFINISRTTTKKSQVSKIVCKLLKKLKSFGLEAVGSIHFLYNACGSCPWAPESVFRKDCFYLVDSLLFIVGKYFMVQVYEHTVDFGIMTLA